MAEQRPIWRGQLRLALVSCPVALYAAHHERANLHFHFINPQTGHRVKMITLDAGNEHPVKRGDLARGYEYKKDHFLILSDEDFESVKVESSTTLKIDKFVETKDVDPVYFDTSYYVAPDGEGDQDVYVVLRDAIARTGRMALSRLVIGRRERAVGILPMGKGLVLHTLFEARDLNASDRLFADVPSAKPDKEMVDLAALLIDRQTAAYEPVDTEDKYESRLRSLIEAKIAGQEIEEEDEAPEDRSNVVDLMAALKKSLGGGEAKPDAKAEAKPAAKPKAAAKKPAAKAEPEPAPKAKAPARKRA